MSEAHPFELNYGHLGEPVYDSENQEWRFARKPVITQKLQPLGQPVAALRGSRKHDLNVCQNATERAQNIRHLTHQYPELLPSATFLPDLAQKSEAVVEVTSSHDPTVSDLLAFGRALVGKRTRRGAATVPIAAVPGGSGGEAVRLVLLSKEQLAWEDSKNVKLSSLTAKGGELAWWFGNGSAIQQLVFADMEGEAAPWLAVRYGGMVSILQPLLQPEISAPKHTHPDMFRHPLSRLDPNHIATLPAERSGRVSIADVTFNPWNNHQIATIDQCGYWNIWNLKPQIQKMETWSIHKSMQGNVSKKIEQYYGESEIIADGWGAILWANEMKTIIVCSRTTLAIYDIKDEPQELIVPSNLSKPVTDWILNIKCSPSDRDHIFVLTSSSLVCLRISTLREVDKSTDSAPGARCLLSWRHFCDSGDLSLRLSITQASETLRSGKDITTLHVMLYSPLSKLTTVYNMELSTSPSEQSVSASDPYILKIPDSVHLNPETRAGEAWPKSRISAMVLRDVQYDKLGRCAMPEKGQMYTDNHICFYQLSILFNDLALSETIYAGSKMNFTSTIDPPELRIRKGSVKTPARVSDEFILSDGVVYHDFRDPEAVIEQAGIYQHSELSEPELLSGTESADEDPWTISFQWLEKDVRRVFAEPARTERLDEVLDLLYSKIDDLSALGNPSVETLLHLVNTVVTVVDIDKASTDLTDFFGDVTKRHFDDDSTLDAQTVNSVSIPSLLTMSVKQDLGLEDHVQLLQVYDRLIKSWITPLSLEIPGRARIALEKLLRNLAAQTHLASHAVRVESEPRGNDARTTGDDDKFANLQFALPVRRKVSASNLGKSRESTARSSSPLASSQISEDVGFMPSFQPAALPTPELTPSPHSQNSASSLQASEDPASLRLKAYCSLATQPSLPIKMSNILKEWEIGGDPDSYNWEVSQRALHTDESEDESQAKERQQSEKRRKRQRQDTVASSSQPPPKRSEGSQQQAQEAQGSSQPTQSLTTASQPEPGRFGGSHSKHKKKKFGSQGKRPGF